MSNETTELPPPAVTKRPKELPFGCIDKINNPVETFHASSKHFKFKYQTKFNLPPQTDKPQTDATFNSKNGEKKRFSSLKITCIQTCLTFKKSQPRLHMTHHPTFESNTH